VLLFPPLFPYDPLLSAHGFHDFTFVSTFGVGGSFPPHPPLLPFSHFGQFACSLAENALGRMAATDSDSLLAERVRLKLSGCVRIACIRCIAIKLFVHSPNATYLRCFETNQQVARLASAGFNGSLCPFAVDSSVYRMRREQLTKEITTVQRLSAQT
jgi:hypothetical protein